MARYLTIAAAALLLGWTALPPAAQAQQQSVCGDHSDVVSKLKKGHSEDPVSMGLGSNGAVIEVFASPSGTFTIVMTLPNGISCLMMAGESWQDLPRQIVGAQT